MNATLQNILVILLVAGAAFWLIYHFARRKSACGKGDCHCEPEKDRETPVSPKHGP